MPKRIKTFWAESGKKKKHLGGQKKIAPNKGESPQKMPILGPIIAPCPPNPNSPTRKFFLFSNPNNNRKRKKKGREKEKKKREEKNFLFEKKNLGFFLQEFCRKKNNGKMIPP